MNWVSVSTAKPDYQTSETLKVGIVSFKMVPATDFGMAMSKVAKLLMVPTTDFGMATPRVAKLLMEQKVPLLKLGRAMTKEHRTAMSTVVLVLAHCHCVSCCCHCCCCCHVLPAEVHHNPSSPAGHTLDVPGKPKMLRCWHHGWTLTQVLQWEVEVEAQPNHHARYRMLSLTALTKKTNPLKCGSAEPPLAPFHLLFHHLEASTSCPPHQNKSDSPHQSPRSASKRQAKHAALPKEPE